MSTIGARGQAVIETVPARDGHPAVIYRHAGDRFLLVEYGEMTLDLTINFRILGFNEELKRQGLRGLVETVPALRSILIHYDSTKLSTSDLIAALKRLEEKVPTAEHLTIPSRIVTLPIAFADHWTRANVEQYVKYVRKDAPNVVDGYNIDYITQYNGLRDREEVITYIMGTDWWNACLGFWPGLPFMFPLDPRYARSEEHTSELQSRVDLVCRLLLEKKKRLAAAHQDRRPPRAPRRSPGHHGGGRGGAARAAPGRPIRGVPAPQRAVLRLLAQRLSPF